jgi:hypothetical protein
MTDSIELPVLTHLGHSKPRDRSASKTSLRMPDVVAPSATMGAASGSGSLGNIEAQEIPGITLINSRDSGEADPLLLRDKIVSEDELNEIRKYVFHLHLGLNGQPSLYLPHFSVLTFLQPKEGQRQEDLRLLRRPKRTHRQPLETSQSSYGGSHRR